MTRQKITKISAISVISFLALTGLVSNAHAGKSIWSHNGSQMLLESSGNSRVISYLHPRRGISARPGQILFQGHRVGNQYVGTAYTFRRGCQPAPYEVSAVLKSETRIVLRGASPKRSGCRVIGYTNRSGNAKLVFTYLRKPYVEGYGTDSDEPAYNPPQRPPQQPPQQRPQSNNQPEGPQGSPAQYFVKHFAGGKVTFKVEDQDAPAQTPIRIDVNVQCDSGQRVNILKNFRTCAFDGIHTNRQNANGLTYNMQLRDFKNGSCSDPLYQPVHVGNICR